MAYGIPGWVKAADFSVKDREEAGRMLGRKLKGRKLGGALVLAIPRGGVAVGCGIANAMKLELDIAVPRKLKDQQDPELAIGAVMPDGSMFLNEDVIAVRGTRRQYIEEERARGMEEAGRRLRVYRGGRKYPAIKGRVVLLVDDGIATGATVIAAARWLRKGGAARTIIAVPVVAASVLPIIRREADEVVCLAAPVSFIAIGQFYGEFEQVGDSEVVRMLKAYWKGWDAAMGLGRGGDPG